MAKNNVLIYTDCLEQLEYLTMEERGILFTAILNYQAGTKMPELDRYLNLIFIPIRQQIDRSNEAYARKCERNRENALKRLKANAGDGKRAQAMAADNDTDTDTDTHTDTDTDTHTDTDTDTQTISSSRHNHTHNPQDETDDVGKVMQQWNGIPHARKIKSIIPCTKRWNELILAFDMFGTDSVLAAIRKVGDSKYLQKRGNVNFDNFMNPNVIQRLLEGTYDEDFKEANASDGLDFSS